MRRFLLLLLLPVAANWGQCILKRFLIFALLIPLGCHAESPWSKLYKASVAAVITGLAADAGTSWGKCELNPVLRSGNGTFATRGLAIKGGLAGGSLLTTWILHRHVHGAAPAVIGNFSLAAVWGAIAVHNSYVSKYGSASGAYVQ